MEWKRATAAERIANRGCALAPPTRQGCMRVRHRTSIGRTPGVLALLTLAMILPAGASANPLLSGYGGPGQGSQTIIGSSLVNPPGGGGSARASGGASGSELTVAASQQSKSSGSSGAAGHSRKAHRKGAGGAPRSSSTAPAGGAPAASLAQVSSSSSAGTLGLSAGDLLLIVFGLTVLALTGVLTRRLTRRTPQ